MLIKIVKSHDEHDLWKRDLYLQPIDYIIGANIYEYDMREAGYNLCIYYELLPQDTLDYLSRLTKEERTYRIGLLMRDDRVFAKTLTKSFAKMRKRFFSDNILGEGHILSIKKDAVFLLGKTCDKTKYENVEWVMKNRFSSFHRFNNMEYYFRNRDRSIAVKGIDDDKLIYHEDYMLAFLRDIFSTLEVSDNSRVIPKIKRFASQYKRMELDQEYYRELNSSCMFTLSDPKRVSRIQSLYYMDGFDIDHRFNYMTYILRLIQRYFFLTPR